MDAAVAEEFRDRYRCFVVDEYQGRHTAAAAGAVGMGWGIATI
ncbi:hypothetical protein I545_6948 [Mycobacterium kansasii 662]|uniref:Uncharacterized protein n=1 Tax=Mycobacterium kansasii 662 TaxID=1299326 RepID=X7XQT1_MYCKA|nr:hypothetical protein I545_6948 [Mycobacterium kansasii 662]